MVSGGYVTTYGNNRISIDATIYDEETFAQDLASTVNNMLAQAGFVKNLKFEFTSEIVEVEGKKFKKVGMKASGRNFKKEEVND